MLSKDVFDVRLLQMLPSSEFDSDDAGETGRCWLFGAISANSDVADCGTAFGVGKSSLIGDTTLFMAICMCGAALRIET